MERFLFYIGERNIELARQVDNAQKSILLEIHSPLYVVEKYIPNVYIWRITYHAQKYSATMHDYYRIKLSESLIFLGFSRLLEFELMGVIWREEKNMSKHLFFRDT